MSARNAMAKESSSMKVDSSRRSATAGLSAFRRESKVSLTESPLSVASHPGQARGVGSATTPDSSCSEIAQDVSALVDRRQGKSGLASYQDDHTSVQPGNSQTQSEPKPQQFLVELDSLLEAISSNIPCNQEAPINQRHRRAFQKVMERYFRQLETAFPYQKLIRLYDRHVTEE